MVSELTKIAVVHLYTQGFEGEDLVNFEMELTAPSIIYDQQKVALMTEKMTLAVAMKDSKLVSDKFLYEYIFNMSEDQWLQERNNVIEDLKLRFRQTQIEQEGNDPSVTGMSFGTPHYLASIHMSSDEAETKDLGGRPKEGIKFGQHKNAFGWDPVGNKQFSQDFDTENQKAAFQPNPRIERGVRTISSESRQMIKQLSSFRKTPSIITESLNTEKQDTDAGTLLDENNIL